MMYSSLVMPGWNCFEAGFIHKPISNVSLRMKKNGSGMTHGILYGNTFVIIEALVGQNQFAALDTG